MAGLENGCSMVVKDGNRMLVRLCNFLSYLWCFRAAVGQMSVFFTKMDLITGLVCLTGHIGQYKF